MITPTKNYIAPKNPLIGSRVPCPFGCQHLHVVVYNQDVKLDGVFVNDELIVKDAKFVINGMRTSICDSLKKANGGKPCRILWSSGNLLSESEADELYKVWQAEIFRQAENYHA